jgi:predicted nucleic acid-binding Zn ribbon protein
MAAPAPEVCPACGEGPVEVVLHPVAVHFKGSGFYSTDYGRGGRRKGESSRDGDSGSGEKSEKTEKSEKSEKSEKKDSPVEKKAAEA